MTYHAISNSTPSSTPKPIAKVTVSSPTRVTAGLSSTPTKVVPTAGQVAPEGFHYMADGTLMSDVEHKNMQCNSIYYHLFSMCHTGIEPYNFQQGSIIVWEGSSNFISNGSTVENLEHNNVDFYFSVGQPEVGQTVGVTDKVGLSCMVYVGYIPYPLVNPVKLTKLVTSTNLYENCYSCVDIATKGCVDSSANNYNYLATIDEGGCKYSNLPCNGCCINRLGGQYTPTQPCICVSGYTLSKSPCVVRDKPKPCKTCCHSKTRGIYLPANNDCSCEKGDSLSPCKEDKIDLEFSACTNCCTNKSGKIFTPKLSSEYGCSCVSGSWSVPCKDVKLVNGEMTSLVSTVKGVTTTTIGGCVATTCKTGSLLDNTTCKCVSTLVDTCENKIDSGFNETLSHLPISNHLDTIRKLSGGHSNSWNTYKFKHYPTSNPKNHDDLCVAIDGWSDTQDAYWTYVKSISITYTPEGKHQGTIKTSVSSFSELYSYTSNTLSSIGVALDKTKEVWDSIGLWNNDTSVWTPGVFSIDYELVYCDCYDSYLLPNKQKPVKTTEKLVRHVFGGKEGVYVVKEDNLTNYKCTSGTNPVVPEQQQTCVPTDEVLGEVGVYDNINACINSGCAGYMSCGDGTSVDGVKFGKEEKTYTPIVMCCESLIKKSKEKLSRGRCLSECGGNETWYPLYNVYAPNVHNESPLGYMVRELLKKVNNRECEVSRDSRIFKSRGFVERLK